MTIQAIPRIRKQRGFSLLEVLIAVVVLAAGLLALTALQGALVRSSADSKARSQLVAYAQSVMDRARQQGYGAFATGRPLSQSAFWTNPAPYADAATAATAELASVATAMGAGSVTDTSTVTRVVSGTNEYKVVDLKFDWVDAQGATRSVQLKSIVSPLVLTQNELVDYDNSTSINYRPIVRRPTPVTEGMIPIAVGNGEDTAATNPKPQLVGNDNNTLVADTRFDLLTFNASDNNGQSNYVRFDKRIETAMVGCTCQTGLNGFPTGGNAAPINDLLKARAYRPTYWDGTRYTEPKAATYTPARSPADGVVQSQLCDICCRDHEDDRADTGTPKFNAWLTSHDHYLDPAGSAVTSGNYHEACRVIRVEGVWRVATDPQVRDVSLLPTNTYSASASPPSAPADNTAATSALVSTDGKNAYVTFAYDFIKQFFYDKTALTATELWAMQGAAGLNAPQYVPINPGEKRWLHARAILTDYLEPEAVTRRDKAITACTGTTTQLRAQCVLPYVPMATINATELAEWTAHDTTQTGLVHSGSLALLSTLKNYGVAKLRPYVSGLALVGPVNPSDSAPAVKDEQTFALTAGNIRTGTWLAMASPAGVLFGNPLDPKRGFASVTGGTPFQIVLSGLPYSRDNVASNDPSVNVGLTLQPCNSTDTARGGNPFACTSGSSTNVDIAVGRFNYLATSSGNINNPCTGGIGKIGQGQATCVAYSLVGGTLLSGLAGKPSEVSKVTLPAVATNGSYTLTFSGPTEVDATAVCNVNNEFVQWKCE